MHPQYFKKIAFVVLMLLASLSAPLHAAVNDIFPSDYYPLPPGTTIASLYAYDRAQAGPYVRGDKKFDGQIASSILALRLSHIVQIGETTVAGVIALPWVKSEVSPAPLANALGKRAEGLTDLRLGVTAWVINDPVSANYLGISGMVIAPTGDYDHRQIVNAGENRWKFILGGGWQKDITSRFLVELSPEIAFYGDNKDYVGNRRLEQETSYALTSYLRWRVSPTWHVHLGAQLNRGGETRVKSLDQNNPNNNDRVMAGITWLTSSQQQIILRLAKDTAIDNGFRTEHEVSVRYQKAF